MNEKFHLDYLFFYFILHDGFWNPISLPAPYVVSAVGVSSVKVDTEHSITFYNLSSVSDHMQANLRPVAHSYTWLVKPLRSMFQKDCQESFAKNFI